MEWLFSLLEAPFIWASHLRRPRDSKKPSTPLPPQCIGYSRDPATFDDPVDIPPHLLERHAYLLGSTGTGKTNLIMNLLERDLERRHSLVVVDLRGDLVERALVLCVHKGIAPERVTLLDLREKDWVVGFTPLAGCGEPFVRSLHLLDILRAESDSWGVQLEETLRNALLLLAHSGHPVTDLNRLLFDEDFLLSLLNQCEEPTVHDFFERYRGLSEERQLSFALPVLNKVTPLLATPGLRAVLGSPKPIALEKLLDRGGSVVLVSLAVDELHRSSRMLGALIVASISRVMCSRVGVPEHKRTPVRLYVDEFESMASEAFEGLIAEGRRFKLSLLLSHQNLSQLPPRLGKVIRNNVGLQLLFRCGRLDADELRRELPDWISPDDLTSFSAGEMLMMVPGSEPQFVQCRLSDTSVDTHRVVALRRAILERIGLPLSQVNPPRSPRTANPPNHLDGPWGLEDGPWN